MNPQEIILKSLEEKYPMLLTKKDLAEVMNCSLSSIDNMLKNDGNIPKPIKFSNAKHSNIRFLNTDVVYFLVGASSKEGAVWVLMF